MIEAHQLSSYVMQVLLVIIVLCIIVKLAQEMRSDSPIQWWQLIATRGADGNSYASASKLWLNIGAVVFTWIVVYAVLQVDWKDRAVEVCALVGSYAVFIGGVEAYARQLKTKGRKDESIPRTT